MSEPKLLILQRRPGRPRLEEPTQSVSTRLDAKHHDLLIRLADERSTSVAGVLRDLVKWLAAAKDKTHKSP